MALRAPVCGMLQLRPYDTLEIQQQLSMVPCRHQGAAVEQEPTAHCRGFHQEHQEEEEEEEEEDIPTTAERRSDRVRASLPS